LRERRAPGRRPGGGGRGRTRRRTARRCAVGADALHAARVEVQELDDVAAPAQRLEQPLQHEVGAGVVEDPGDVEDPHVSPPPACFPGDAI
jgi:hypothetical protein